MTTDIEGGVDRIESAENITLQVSKGSDQSDAQMMEVPIARLDTTKDIEINEIRENSLKASGYSITSISFSGTMMFKGSKLTKTIDEEAEVNLDNLLYDNNGVPVPVSITVTHDREDEYEVFQHVLVTSESYQMRSEETTETAFDWVAMDKDDSIPSA